VARDVVRVITPGTLTEETLLDARRPNYLAALAEAGVGIALGGGTDLARLAGHVVLLADNVADIPWLVALSRRTRRIIIENLGWAFCYNAIAVTAAAAGVLHPLLAAVAMVASSLSAIANSSRNRKFPDPLSSIDV